MDHEDFPKYKNCSEFNPTELDSIEQWAEFLESIFNSSCTIWEYQGKPTLLSIKANVTNIRGLRLEIYPNEHRPPHFHVHSPNVDASFSIDNCELLNGTIRSTDYEKISYWFNAGGKGILIEKWNSTRPTNCVVGKY